ncbi:aldo/keto reductase family oxidoreductase [Hyphomonas hirschiana VP5]|uniref:Aldo/keto reductase family oxidoreductase n=1 Tax=Hyphomonas hirschiana VP5 TaxID=1280951 RepID=A0A059FZD1_9PROT|nr:MULTISPECIES: aldo/keto reductase [Hyphomonas]KCZ95837.1 aldo/keto reductase family oxidoreductase [Hyphomonas hirschiana VP5]
MVKNTQLPSDAVTRLLSKSSGPLGFGTGLLHSVKDKASAVRVLRQAQDEGVTYFDTARLYGEGRCEGMLGEAFSHMRDEVILATKVGILPSARDLATRVKAKAAATLRRLPMLRPLIPEPPVQYPQFGVFDPARMQESFETSLKQLRTDHVDLLLLHECTLEDVQRTEVLEFLDQMVRQGKARAYGVAPRAEDMLSIAASCAPYGDVAQFDAALRSAFPPAGADTPPLIATHSCLGQRFRDRVVQLKTDDQLRDSWSSALGREAGDPATIAQAFLAHAIQQNPGGIVLFSTTQPDRLRTNLDAQALLNSPETSAALAQLMAAE